MLKVKTLFCGMCFVLLFTGGVTSGGVPTVSTLADVVPVEDTADVALEETLIQDVNLPVAAQVLPVVPQEPVMQNVPVKTEVKAPETDAEAGEAIGKAVDLAEQGAWAAMTGFLLMLVVWFLRRIDLLSKIPLKAVPWVTMLLGCVTAVGMVLAGGASWSTALVTGLGGGFMAPAFWEMLFKHLDKGKAKAKSPKK